jgi:hypothetical protein
MADFTTSAESSDDALAAWAAERVCPRCGSTGFRVESVLVAKPLGSFSLAGAQMKVSATTAPKITCGLSAEQGCGASAVGHH